MHSPPVVMIVDDDEDIRFLMTRLMRSEGYEVSEAATAAEAKLATMKTPDLILMDISMPDADGLSVIWDLRKQRKTANVPVVIVSAYDAFDLRAEATAAGCAGYLTKPLDLEELKSLVRKILENLRDGNV